MSVKVFHHPDGGDYVIDNPDIMIKMESGSWEKGLVYRAVAKGLPIQGKSRWQYQGRQFFATTYERWNERFTEVETYEGLL